MNIKKMNDSSQRRNKRKSSSFLKNKTQCCFLDDIDYLALCSKQSTNGNKMIKLSKTQVSISPLRQPTKSLIKDKQNQQLNTSLNLKHRGNNESTFNPNKSMKLINFSQLILNQKKKEKTDISFSRELNINKPSKLPSHHLNASCHNARSSFNIKSDIICPINVVSNRKYFFRNKKTDSAKCFSPSTQLTQPIYSANRLSKVSMPPKADWLKKSYLNNHIKRNSIGNEGKSRNSQAPIQYEWSKQATFTSMEKSIHKKKVDFSYDNRISTYTHNISCNQTNDSSIPKKKDLQFTFDTVKASGPEEMHMVFVILNQHKRKVYEQLSVKLRIEEEGVMENYLEYE